MDTMRNTCLALMIGLLVGTAATAAPIDSYDDFFDDGVIGAQWADFGGASSVESESASPGFMQIGIADEDYSRMSMVAPPIATYPEYILEVRVVGTVQSGGGEQGQEGFFLNSFGGNTVIVRSSNPGANGVYMSNPFALDAGPTAWVQPINWRLTLTHPGASYLLQVEWSADPVGTWYTLAAGADVTAIVTDPSGYRWDMFTDTRSFTTGSTDTRPLSTKYDFFDFSPIPEPATLGLLALGSVVVLGRRRGR